MAVAPWRRSCTTFKEEEPMSTPTTLLPFFAVPKSLEKKLIRGSVAWDNMRILSQILDVLFPPRDTERVVRETSWDSLQASLKPQAVGVVTALLPYHQVRALIIEAKYHDNRSAQNLLGRALAEHVRKMVGPIILVPVPLSRKRLRERGYNQTERICRAAMRHLTHVPIATDLLIRTRATVPQTTLGRTARQTNVAGAFRCTGTPDPHTTYVLIDDVITTGATIGAAQEALHKVDAHVLSIALAHQDANA